MKHMYINPREMDARTPTIIDTYLCYNNPRITACKLSIVVVLKMKTATLS